MTDIDKARAAPRETGDEGNITVALAQINKEVNMHEISDRQHEREIGARVKKDVIVAILFTITIVAMPIFHIYGIDHTLIVGFAGLLLGFLVDRNKPLK